MRNISKKISIFFILIFLFIFSLTVLRLAFLVNYFDVYRSMGAMEILSSLATGLRFDFSTAALMLAPITLIFFFPAALRKKQALTALFSISFLWGTILTGYGFADVLYYAFAQRHMTFELGNTAGDIDVVVKLAFADYKFEILALFVFLAIYARFFWVGKKISEILLYDEGRPKGKGAIFSETFSFVVIIVLSVILIRGGLQFKPLGVKDAFKNEKVELGVLSLNGVYTTFNTFYKRYKGKDPLAYANNIEVPEEKKDDFFRSLIDEKRETVDKDYPLYRRFNRSSSSAKKMNVVIFVMESWSGKFSGRLGGEYPALENFDAMSKKGFLAANCMANAQRSIEGLAAIMGSLPVWEGMTLGEGGLLYQTRFRPIGSIFSELGYDTFFIHGARPGSMGFDGLARRLGFKKHLSRDDFELTPNNNDGIWGIYDEFVFEKADEIFGKSKKPFAAVIFSLTSHSPYTFPEKDFELYGKDTPHWKFLNSLKYSDWALAHFFGNAKKRDYFKNTLFVIVGDHAEGASTGGSLHESYHVPLLFYAPGRVKPGYTSKPVTQLDILPSIVDTLNLSTPFTSWGKSVFSSGERKAVIPRGNLFVFQKGDYALLTDIEKSMALYDNSANKKDNLLDKKGDMAEELREEFKAYVKFSSDIIRENRVSPR